MATAEGPPSTTSCSDNFDNDGDGDVDAIDSGCVAVEGPPGDRSCTDGIDNDGGGIDAADSGCTSTEGPPGELTCNDNVDNDNDERQDGSDPACVLLQEGSAGDPLCADGIDNDNDNRTDSADSGCGTAEARFGAGSSCSDLFDNDSDGDVDAADAACDSFEGPPGHPTCSDGVNNDNDPSGTDTADSGCIAIEGPPGELSCGDGVDNDNDDRADGSDTACVRRPEGPPGSPLCTDGIDNDNDSDLDSDDSGCRNVEGPPSGVTSSSCTDLFDNDGDGDVDGVDSGCVKIEGPPGSVTCSDNIDNDGDGLRDGADSGCLNAEGPPFSASCSDRVDNDGDGLADGDDPACVIPPEGPPGDPTCTDTIDNDGDGRIDRADSGCNTAEGPPRSQSCTDDVDNDGDALIDEADPDCRVELEGPPGDVTCNDGRDNDNDGDTDGTDSGCQSAEGPPFSPSCDDGVDNDNDTLVDSDDPQCQEQPEGPPGNGTCFDDFDNDGDGDVDEKDSGCSNVEGPPGEPSCFDDFDNDGDGQTDDNDSECQPQPEGLPGSAECSDNQDNDGDTRIDLADTDCQAPATARELAEAIVESNCGLQDAAYVALPPFGAPNGVYTSNLSYFPNSGTSFAILTSGNYHFADDPNNSHRTGQYDGGRRVRGNSDNDVTVLRIDCAPAAGNCLSLDFAFYSEEFPEYVGSGFNDAFVAELNSSTWTTSGSKITAPNNFAFGPSGAAVSINSSGATSMSAANAAGTTYDGATAELSAKASFGTGDLNGDLPGTLSLYLSIFDQVDGIYDSAAFVDNAQVTTVATQSECESGASSGDECNGADDDGDTLVDEGFPNYDNDGQADCVDPDDDGDTVLDGPDQCDPDGPNPISLEDLDGFEDGDGCPESGSTEVCDGSDNDGDTLIDEGFPNYDNDGQADCVDPDDDGDTVLDGPDQCDPDGPNPTSLEDLDGFEDGDGCSEPGPAEGPPGDVTCNDGRDNDNDGDTDGTDSGCQSAEGPPFSPSCDDGVDNDNDTLVDSDDPQCQEQPEGPPGNGTCFDDFDNDGDGDVDEKDSGCSNVEGPPGEPSCFDDFDNDGDGQTDDNDSECQPQPEGLPGSAECSDNQDNDGDTRIDLADTDCQAPATARELAEAIVESNCGLQDAAYVALPPFGAPNGVYTSNLSYFPNSGTSFAILTSGNYHFADDPNNSHRTGQYDGGRRVRGNSDNDVTVLRIDCAPAAGNCLSLDFAFYSEEFPEYVGSGFNDAFVAELNSSTWTTSGSKITAPNNFAFGPSGAAVSINSSGATSMSAANAAGTTYDGATAELSAKASFGTGDLNGDLPGTLSLYLSIFDQVDGIYDSAAFVDNAQVTTVATQSECESGASSGDECNGADDDGDTLVDEGFPNYDNDGQADCVDPDDDGDTVLDGPDQCDPDGPNPISLEDLDGFEDGDGCPESGSTEVCDGSDNDGDTLIDEGFPNYDNDGQADCVDPDDDGDTVLDGPDQCDPDGPNPTSLEDLDGFEDGDGCQEAGSTEVCDGSDNDGDTVVDEGFPNYDNDGQADCVDPDDDGDTVLDGPDQCDPDGPNPTSLEDLDGFEDGDGCQEAGSTEVCDGSDNDGDTVVDEGFPNYDNDGQADCVDPDDDGDTVLDGPDQCDPDGPNPTSLEDLDGFEDGDGCQEAGSTEVCDGSDNDGDTVVDEGFPNYDNDGQADCVDPDDDGDTVLDGPDQCDPDGPNPTSLEDLDGFEDGDGCFDVPPTSAAVTLTKTYSNGSTTALAAFTLECTSGTITPSALRSRRGGGTVSWTVTGFSAGASCSVSESTIPVGYVQAPLPDGNTCTSANLALSAGATRTCTIGNNALATVTLTKTYSDGSTTAVAGFTISCTGGGTITPGDTQSRTGGGLVIWTVTGFGAGASCSVTESMVPSDYVQAPLPPGNTCTSARLSLSANANRTCTIRNNARATVTVTKTYSDGSTAGAGFTLNCSGGGTIAPAAIQSRTGGGTVSWTVTGFSAGASCTVTESTVPSGYVQGSNNCTSANLGLSAGANRPCTIGNNARATVTLTKTYSDGSTTPVAGFRLDCSGGGTIAPAAIQGRTGGGTVSWMVTGFSAGASCTVTESTVPAGYVQGSNNCTNANLGLSAGATRSCAIGNTPRVICNGKVATIVGTSGNDQIQGTGSNDVIAALGGNDNVNGQGGNDTICLGSGADVAAGGTGNDTISGEEGNDTISGGDGKDTIDGDAGNDVLNGGPGGDTLRGWDGIDRLEGDAGDDDLLGGSDADTLLGEAGNDHLAGGDGNDRLFGGEGKDTLNSQGGNDELHGGPDDDRAFGSPGIDLIFGDDGNDWLDGDRGDDTIFGGDGSDTIFGGLGNDQAFGQGGDDDIYGDVDKNCNSGSGGHDTLSGGEGDDTICGQNGNDLLNGNDGRDNLYGGFGNDELHGGAAPSGKLNFLSGGTGTDCASNGPDKYKKPVDIEKFGVCP